MISKYIAGASATNPKMMAAAFDKTLEVGLSMDPKLVAAAVAAHAKDIEGAVGNPGIVASKADFAAVNEALARMMGSADPAKFKAILTASLEMQISRCHCLLQTMRAMLRLRTRHSFRSLMQSSGDGSSCCSVL